MSTSRKPDGPGAAAPCQPSSSFESSSSKDPDTDPGGLLFPVTRSSLLARRLLRLRANSRHSGPLTRRKREMISDDQKDATYWDKRQKNNQAAKRSREKRRLNDLMLEGQLLALSDENAQLRAQLLSLQYHRNMGAEKSRDTCAKCTASVSLSTSPGSAFLQPGLWGNGNQASVLRQQVAATNPFGAKIPYFGSSRGVFNPQSSHKCGAQQGYTHSGQSILSPRVVVEGGRSAEAELDTQLQVSSSDDIHNSTDASSINAFLPTPDKRHHASILSYPPGNWLVPHLNHSAVCNNFLLPWRSSYLTPPAVYPGLPLYRPERQGQGVGVETDIQGTFKSRLSSAPAVLTQGLHLSPDGR
ncbi:uncharacterized protein si:dkey-172o19.2 [Plectropomus leopardus]|uniref:uncharacterized protein si:dkey-172o19.2 n=1 Tax=Plectropomus leopardus TaxID=160734 RepID=UPI001C4D0BED|nr:uncharacterized protein si:dkey-172o19.2 [Plectropomus leopardus]